MPTEGAASASIPVETVGPSGIRGELYVVALTDDEKRSDSARLNDRTPRQFKIAARLAKSPAVSGNIKGDFDANDGSSYFHVPQGQILSRVRCSAGVFEIKKNEQDEQSLIEFECQAESVAAAKTLFLETVLPFLDHQAYLADCPLFIEAVRIEDPTNGVTSIDYISPYRQVVVSPHIKLCRQELAPVYAMYRDAKNSHSDFYKFLCYHKILEGLLGSVRSGVRQRAQKKGVELSKRRELIPFSDAIVPEYKEWQGKSVKAFFDGVMTPQFRNAVAHFILANGQALNLSAPKELLRYANILHISELCVRTVIETQEAWLTELS